MNLNSISAVGWESMWGESQKAKVMIVEWPCELVGTRRKSEASRRKSDNCFTTISRFNIDGSLQPIGRIVHLMKTKSFLIGVFVLLPLLTPALADDINGRWSAQIHVGQETTRIGFTFGVDGTKLVGTVSDPQGISNISEGKINGTEISFIVVRNFDGKEKKLVYRGKIREDEISFTRKVEDGGQPQEFTAKREFQGTGNRPSKRYITLP
jgi:hypothetical protein